MIVLVIAIWSTCKPYNYTLDETEYECTSGWWLQYTSRFRMELINQDFDNNPKQYYINMAENLQLKLKNCGYETIEEKFYYGCLVCQEWKQKN
jgi:hypothetical protein